MYPISICFSRGLDLLEIVEGTVNKNQKDESSAKSVNRGNCIPGRYDSPNSEGKHGTNGGSEVNGSSTHSIDEERHRNVDKQAPSFESTVNAQLSLWARNTHVVHDLMEIVRDQPISGPLREEPNGRNDTDPLPIAFGAEEIHPRVCFSFFLQSNSSTNFRVFELDEFICGIVVCVVVGEGFKCLLFLPTIDLPSGTFGNPPHHHKDNDGADTLQKRRETP